jgi:hypothetical protein
LKAGFLEAFFFALPAPMGLPGLASSHAGLPEPVLDPEDFEYGLPPELPEGLRFLAKGFSRCERGDRPSLESPPLP